MLIPLLLGFLAGILWPGSLGEAARYKKGDVVRVYVDPDNHQVSALQPTPPLSLCLVSIALSAACFAIGYWTGIAPAIYPY
jgi:hypothetical protein